MVIPSL